jgi:hypothetical protein
MTIREGTFAKKVHADLRRKQNNKNNERVSEAEKKE